ncbi:peptidylprolyl isomerase [Candidatus Bathyarchaeota archaeon A05DMB-2]|jgi:peptidylprolyl isomerase|nr:peptidylprolyl isomerase [Candidatus Bathyarchaeota archaeon A05DMB-2]
MPLQKGDFILIDYTAKVKETNEVFDTTNEETSKKENLHKEGEIYEPKLVVIGEGWVLKELDEKLTTMEPGKIQTVEIPPEKAFGPRDPEKVKRVPLKQLLAKDIHNPTIGMRIEYGGKNATIRAIGAGRVLLDFNPPLAGKTLIYDVTVNKKLETNEEKIAALIHRRIPLAEPEKFKFTIKDGTLTIDMPETAFYIEGVQIAKRGIAMDVQKFLPELDEIRFVETFKSEPKPETKPEPKPELKPQASTEEPKPESPEKKPATEQTA